jgi:hypothetical protein
MRHGIRLSIIDSREAMERQTHSSIAPAAPLNCTWGGDVGPNQILLLDRCRHGHSVRAGKEAHGEAGSLTASHTASATSCARVTSDDCCIPANIC